MNVAVRLKKKRKKNAVSRIRSPDFHFSKIIFQAENQLHHRGSCPERVLFKNIKFFHVDNGVTFFDKNLKV